MECKIDPSEIDRNGILSLLKRDKNGNVECIYCNFRIREVKNIKCPNCPFIKCSGERKTKADYFTGGVACGAAFRPFGIPPEGRLGKSYLFYFLFYPELEWSIPDGEVLHHKDGNNYNDHKSNLERCLAEIHSSIESNERKMEKIIIEDSNKYLK